MNSWHSYPKVWALGHAAIKELFDDPIHAEEKIDGSQFSFGVFNGELKVRSKGQELHLAAPEKMFLKAIETVKELQPLLNDGWTYRAEYLQKPKHNVLAYNRTPNKFLILFDINTGQEQYLSYEDKKKEADRLGLECVPILFSGKISNPAEVFKLLELESCLGGKKIEGIVFKNYSKFGPDKKACIGKHVSESFKEIHRKEWKEENPGQNDIITLLSAKYKSEARWQKAVQHLKEKGRLTGTPADIGLLMKETMQDAQVECEAEIKEDLYKWAWAKIQRTLTHGLPEWYKKQLLEKQFEESDS